MSDAPQGLPPLREVIARHGLAASKALGQNFLFDERGRPEIGVRNEKKQKAGFGTKEGVGPGIRSDGADHSRKIIFGFEADWKYRHTGPFLYMS